MWYLSVLVLLLNVAVFSGMFTMVTESEESCTEALGNEEGHIPDSALTASSQASSDKGPENARLNSVHGIVQRCLSWASADWNIKRIL